MKNSAANENTFEAGKRKWGLKKYKSRIIVYSASREEKLKNIIP